MHAERKVAAPGAANARTVFLGSRDFRPAMTGIRELGREAMNRPAQNSPAARLIIVARIAVLKAKAIRLCAVAMRRISFERMLTSAV
jgi:hypothetical protein